MYNGFTFTNYCHETEFSAGSIFNKEVNMDGRTKDRYIRRRKCMALILCITLTFLSAGCGNGSRRDNLPDPSSMKSAESESSSPSGPADKSHLAEKGSSADAEKSGSENDFANGKDNGREKDAMKTDSESNDKTAGKADPMGPFRVGDTLQDGDLKILYMASGKYDGETVYQQPQDGCQYIFLQFAFQNTGLKYDCPISLFSFQCYADGFAAQAYYGGEKEPASSLSAGRSDVGRLYFCVPEDADRIEVEYQPDHLSRKKVCFLYEGEKDAGTAPAADTRRSEGACRVGTTVSSEQQKITYVSCEKDDSDNDFLHPEQGNSFWTLTFEIENLREEDSQISVSDFFCYADGQSCSRRLFRDDYLSADIAGGRKAKGTVSFEVPDTAQTVEAEYKTGHHADARVIFTMR